MTKLLIDVTKLCKKCNNTLPITSFFNDKKSTDGLGYYCKDCAKENSRKNHNLRKANNDLSYMKMKRSNHYKTKYGITLEEREKLLKDQGYACAICQTPLQFEGTLTHTDHCHTTGKVRGILCTNCNRGLGHFKDNVNSLKNAIYYLERHL